MLDGMGLVLNFDGWTYGKEKAVGGKQPFQLSKELEAGMELRMEINPNSFFEKNSGKIDFETIFGGWSYMTFLNVGGWTITDGQVSPSATLVNRIVFPGDAVKADFNADSGELILMTGGKTSFCAGYPDVLVGVFYRLDRGIVSFFLLHSKGEAIISDPVFASVLSCFRFE